ncbi:hypothetical protein ACFQ08_38710 [Streptosporangium algeriense]|uniref:4Fe-4S Wbl-type domain-containing protein n=1 Tax=Streptosporangium algeriense TaxID=1682748 RepID=A0ABW3E6H2_9ACTN
MCATCPALLLCGLYATEVRPSSGIWAGRTPVQVAQLDRFVDLSQQVA